MSSSPIPLKTSLFIYTKGAKQSWLTGTVSNKSIQLSTSKTKALKLVAERAGNYYTLRVYGIKKYLAAGNPGGTAADCTAVFTTNPKGMQHYWNVVTTSTGMRISTVQPCTERGKKVVQFLKVVPSSSGGHLELASKDSDIFFSISANSSGPGTAPTPRPVTGTPARSESTGQLKIQSAPQIPKIITIEPYNRPGYFLGPKSMATNDTDGSLQAATSRVLWYTDATSTSTSISMRVVQFNGPSLGVSPTCASPILSRISSGSTRFIIGTVSGYNGFIIRTSTVCNDNKYRYLVLHTNGTPGVSPNAPTSKTIQQHLWRFSIGATLTPTPDITIAPIQTPSIPPTTFQPTTTPTPDTFPPLTPAPTFQPTFGPTIIPTMMPTYSPTEVPTIAPTESPTFAPTESPTFAPTESPTFAPTESPTLPPLSSTPSPTNPPGGGSGPININIDAGRPDRVVFPYPVTPDLLLANPDGSLNATGGLMTDAPSTTPTALPSETALPDGDLILPQFEDGESEENSDDEEDDTVYTGLWTTPVLLISILVLLTVFIGGYYLYNKSQSTSTNTSSVNAGGSNNALTNTLNNSLNAPLNTGTPDTFGDGFNDFANVENIGPPPPTTTTR